AKFYYDRYNCRYFAPFLLLFIYSLLGAWIFYLVEYQNEKEMKLKESKDLERLRHNSFLRFLDLFQTKRRNERAARSRDLLLWYEKELEKVKLPEALEWDMWGALFYVGTIFTTIGYGNIVPRTIPGRALSVVYAIIGIPLVLAILSRFGQFLEHTITRAWQKHREKFKTVRKKTKRHLKMEQSASLNDLEEGKHITEEKSDFLEDHLIEDSRTIPIWLALFICVSWICACAALFLIWEKRWTFFTSLYFFFISLSTIGLEMPTVYGIATQMDNLVASMACDPMSEIVAQVNGETQWSTQPSLIQQEPLHHVYDEDDRDSMSDATSLPLDSVSFPRTKTQGKVNKKVAFSSDAEPINVDSSSSGSLSIESEAVEIVDSHVQTDISQFQIDEIVLRLAALQDLGVNTHQQPQVSCGVSTQPVYFRTQSVETDIHDFITKSVETDDAVLLDKSMETSRSEYVDADTDAPLSWADKVRRDMMTSPVIRRLIFKTAGTSNRSGSTDESRSNADHSQQTSMLIDRPRSAIDREQQTSIIIDRARSAIDREQQTSIVTDRPSSAIDREQQTSTIIDQLPRSSLDDAATQSSLEVHEKMTSPILLTPLGRSMQTSLDETMNRSQQTSVEHLNAPTEPTQMMVVSTAVGPDGEAEPYHPGTDWDHLSNSFYGGRMTDSMEMSTQCSPPMSRSVTTQNSRNLGVMVTRARSSSTSGLGTSIYDETRQFWWFARSREVKATFQHCYRSIVKSQSPLRSEMKDINAEAQTGTSMEQEPSESRRPVSSFCIMTAPI
ncbi:hypothetical protein GCK32_009728, partial [Trichostrongylus colubriformis]